MNDLNSDQCEQGLMGVSEPSEYLPELRKERMSRETDLQQGQLPHVTQGISTTQTAGGGDSSDYSQESSNCIGNNVSVPKFSWFKSMSQIVGLTAAWQQDKEGSLMGANTVSSAKANITIVHSEFNFFL